MSTELLEDARASAARGAAFGRLLRPDAARLPLLVFVAAAVRTHPGPAHVLGGALLILAAYGAAAAFNDLHDLDVDRANGRDLPLVDGTLTAADAWWACAGCAVVVAAAQLFLVQPLGLVVTSASLLLSIAYSHPALAVERRGAWGTALLAVTYVGLPAVLAGPPPGDLRLAAAMAATAAMLLYKDVKDEAGDRAHGKRTPLVRWGIGRVDTVATVLLLAAVAAALVAVPRWPAVLLAGGAVAQRAMVRGARQGPELLRFQLLVVAGAIALVGV